MLTARRAILWLALLLAMIGDSSGQSPPEPPRQNHSGTQQRTNTDQRNTDQAPPSIIKIFQGAEQAQQKPTADEQKGPEKPSDAWTLSDKIAAIASIASLLQFFALFATIVVLMLTARQQLRAYVFISKAEVSDIMSNQNLAAKLVIKNFGQTPAYNLVASLRVDIDQFPLIIASLPADIQQIKNVSIGPGGEHTLVFNGAAPSPMEWRAGFEQKISAVYVHGTITYIDAFKCSRFTNFHLYKGGDAGVSGPELSFSIDDNKAN